MKPTSRILSHLVVTGIGIAIAISGTGLPRQDDSLDSSDGKSRQHGGRSVAGSGQTVFKKADRPSKETLTTEDFQQTWDGLVSRKLSRAERIPIQRKLLETWSQIDLRGALDAAMKEAWGGGDDFVGTSAFSQVFADRPLDAWALIQSGRYGVGSQALRDQWVVAVLEKNRLLVASMLSEFPGRMADRVIPKLLRGIQSDPERDTIVAKIIAQAGDDHPDWLQETFKRLPVDGDPATLRDRWNALPTGSSRQVAMLRWSVSLRDLGTDQLAAELAHVPTEAKGEVTKALLPQLQAYSPGLLAALEFALSSDQWEAVAKSAAPLLAGFSGSAHTDPVELSEWGANLPERPDTVEIYHAAIGRYIRDDLPRAKAWLEAMPEGSWHREHGLAEFSNQALLWVRDPAASQWALDSISDPEVRAEASKWRQEEQKRTDAGTH